MKLRRAAIEPRPRRLRTVLRAGAKRRRDTEVGLLLAGTAAFLIAVSTGAQAGPAADEAVPAGLTPAATGEEETAARAVPLDPPDDTDARIADRLRTIFTVVDELDHIEVRARAGVVKLAGTVGSEADRDRAVEIAAALEGVAYVDDDIEVSDSVEERIDPLAQTFARRGRGLVKKLPLVLLALALFAPFVALAKLLSRWEWPFRAITRSGLIGGILQRLVATAVVFIGIVLALEVLDATRMVGAVLGTAGVLGVAVGFALRDIVENYFASIMLGLRRPFSVQDHVVIDDLEGKVVRMTTRETILMTLDGNHLRIPNSSVFKAVILNYTHNPLRRFEFVVGAGVDVDLAAAQRLGVRTLAAMKGVLPKPAPFSWIEELGESSVAIRFFGWIDQRETDIFKARSEAIRRVKVALDEAGVDMPEPTFRLRWQKDVARPPMPRTEASDEEAHEVDVDHTIEEQIERERGGQNLLE